MIKKFLKRCWRRRKPRSRAEELKILCDSASMMSAALLQSVEEYLKRIREFLSEVLEHLKVLFGEEMRIAIARRLMEIAEPVIVELKPGELKKIDDDIILEKTSDGNIVIYVVVQDEVRKK